MYFVYSFHISKQNFDDQIGLILISYDNQNQPNYFCIRDFNVFIFNKTRHKNKKHFHKYRLQCFSSERALQEHSDMCLEINGKQNLNLESSSIRFKKYFKQTALPCKIYTDAKYILVKLHINNREKKNFIY